MLSTAWSSQPTEIALPGGSNVKRLSHYFEQHWPNVHLRLLSESFHPIFTEEKDCFDTTHQHFWLRKIFLCSDTTPLSYARVVVPEATYQRFQNQFDQLKQNPIGETLLHHNPAVTRSEFEYRHIPSIDPLYLEMLGYYPDLKQPAIGRRSVFLWESLPLLITEILLMAREEAICTP